MSFFEVAVGMHNAPCTGSGLLHQVVPHGMPRMPQRAKDSQTYTLALDCVDTLLTAACVMIDILVEECRLNQDVPPQPCEG